ncbi:MAG: M23 family peptidase, partial [Paenibacillus sp.]|nr:M23 family peptidase [Paenibacillus sp.]
MKQRLRSNSMTVLVIREAERAVKQVRVPKLLVISVPIAALMSVSGLILSMQLTSQQSIHDLEDQLEQQKMALEITVNNKDEVIRTLRQEVIRLAKETKIVQDQMDQIHDLEQELEQFVKQHISEDAVSSRSSNAPSLITLVQADIDDDDSLLRLAEQSSFNLKRVQ